jgi:hypothetical protein
LSTYVVDTNVAVVANRNSPQAGPPCVLACVNMLEQVVLQGRVLLDDQSRILNEYMRNLSMSGQPGFGDAFLKWVWQNQANTDVCEKVVIHPRSDSGEDYQEFPDDPALSRFDRSDRKFVAVAVASNLNPETLNAVDRDWWDFRVPLESHGLRIRFLCHGQFDGD